MSQMDENWMRNPASGDAFNGLFERSADAMFWLDGDRIVDCNPSAARLMRLEREQLRNRSLYQFSPELQPDGQRSSESMAEALRTAFVNGSHVFEWTLSDPDGADLTAEISLTGAPCEDRQLLFSIWRNITERKKREADLLREIFARRGYQVKVSTEIAQEMAAAATVDELLRRVVTLIKERLGYYHTQVLRYEPNLNAVVLVKGYGEAGEKMLAMGHSMAMGRGLIGLAAVTGQTIMRTDVTSDPDWQPNILLPDTKGEIALPIKQNDQILGVLDVQSNQAGTLTEDDRFLLEGLCGQIAISIESTRLRQEMQERLNELNNFYEGKSREGWDTFSATNRLPAGYLYDRMDVRPVEDIWVDEIEKAVSQNNLIPAESEHSATVAPLAVRGEVVGALGIYADPQHPLTGEELALIEQVSDQVALALDSARLFEQTSVALDEAEKLYNFSRNLAEAADLDSVVGAVVEAAGIPEVCRGSLTTFDYNTTGELTGGQVKASWFNGVGESQGIPVGTRYERGFVERSLKRFLTVQPAFLNEVDQETHKRGIFSLAALPLWVGTSQIGIIMLQADTPHEFTDDEKRPLVSLAQQAAITIQSRLLFDQVTSSEARFRDISMSSADWVWELGAQGAYTFCSERVKDVLGYTATEMLGKTPFDLMVAEELESVGKILSEIMTNKAPIVELENRIRAKNGQERTMLTSGVPVLDDLGNLLGYRGVDRDITERKTLEAAILKDRAQLAEAMEAARMASWEFDNTSGIFTFNDAYYRFLETTLEEEGSYLVPETNFVEKFVHPEDASGMQRQIQAGFDTLDPNYRSEFESRLRKPNGTYRSVLVSLRVEKDALGKTVRMFGTNQDITERKQAQETIAKRAVELATVAEITTRVSTIQNPDEMLQMVVDLTKQVFNLYHVHIYLLNESSTKLAISKGAGEIGREMVLEGREIDYDAEKSLVARAARTRQGVIVNNVKVDPDFLSHPLLPDTRSEMAVPMIGGGRLLGVIDVQDAQVDRFTPEDVNIMTTLAAQIAVSLQNARSYARAQRQAEREALINAISERIQATSSVENALQVAVREIGRALGAQHTAIRLGLERKVDGE